MFSCPLPIKAQKTCSYYDRLNRHLVENHPQRFESNSPDIKEEQCCEENWKLHEDMEEGRDIREEWASGRERRRRCGPDDIICRDISP
jgi:hypothetical protein